MQKKFTENDTGVNELIAVHMMINKIDVIQQVQVIYSHDGYEYFIKNAINLVSNSYEKLLLTDAGKLIKWGFNNNNTTNFRNKLIKMPFKKKTSYY